MKKGLAYLLTMALLATACGGGEEPGGTGDGYTDIEYESGECGVQPMTGIAIGRDNYNTMFPFTQLEYASIRYSDVSSQEGVYNWDPVEEVLTQATVMHHHAILRFYYCAPNEESAVPAFIKQMPDYQETKKDFGNETVIFPHWDNEALQSFHLDFYKKFAERYDSDPRIAFVEAGFGFWSEYLIFNRISGVTAPTIPFQATWLSEMEELFQETPWCISIEMAIYGPFIENDFSYTKDFGFGNFDDSFLCSTYDNNYDYDNVSNWSFFGNNRYKRAPMGGAFRYDSPFDQTLGLSKEGINGYTFESEAKRRHLSFFVINEPSLDIPLLTEVSKTLGYRFQLTRFAFKEGDSVLMTIKNIGIAPIYQDAYPAADGVRSIFNLRALMPGDSATITIATPSASASSVPSVWCDRLYPNQTIDLVSR